MLQTGVCREAASAHYHTAISAQMWWHFPSSLYFPASKRSPQNAVMQTRLALFCLFRGRGLKEAERDDYI